MMLHVLEGFERINFSGKLVRIAVAAIRMQHESIGRSEFSPIFLAVSDEAEFAEFVVPSMKPKVQPMIPALSGMVRVRNHQPIRLHRAVQLRLVTAHD